MLVGQRGSYGYGRARGKFAPVRCTLLLSLPPSARALSVPGALPSPDDANPLVLQIPGSPSATYMSSLRGVTLPPVRFTRRGVPVFPYSRFAAPESALHRRRINTGRHPNSLEVNASFPRAPTTSTSYLPYPTTSFQKPDEGSRPCGEATSISDAASLSPRLYEQDDATRPRPTNIGCIVESFVGASKRSQTFESQMKGGNAHYATIQILIRFFFILLSLKYTITYKIDLILILGNCYFII